jgi:hypothetical protein
MVDAVQARGSAHLFDRALRLMPGGVSSPVRAFGKVGGEPFFVDAGDGALLRDVDGRAYIDLVMSWGALMLGHTHPTVVAAVQEAASRGTSYGAPTGVEVEQLGGDVAELGPGKARRVGVSRRERDHVSLAGDHRPHAPDGGTGELSSGGREKRLVIGHGTWFAPSGAAVSW